MHQIEEQDAEEASLMRHRPASPTARQASSEDVTFSSLAKSFDLFPKAEEGMAINTKSTMITSLVTIALIFFLSTLEIIRYVFGKKI